MLYYPHTRLRAHTATLNTLSTSSTSNKSNKPGESKMSADYIKSLNDEINTLKKDKAALSAELNSTGGDTTPEVDSSTQAIKKALLPRVPGFIANIADLAEAADSEAVMLQANKLLIEWAVTPKLDGINGDSDDEFKDLLKRIQAGAKKADAKRKAGA